MQIADKKNKLASFIPAFFFMFILALCTIVLTWFLRTILIYVANLFLST